jgi:heme/copper-type cytochrome/quinol oxidase subunit 1
MWRALPRLALHPVNAPRGPHRMTVTEERPEVDAETDPSPALSAFESSGLAATLGTGDHKAIGRMYVLFGLVGGMLALGLNLLVSLERTGINTISVLDWSTAEQTLFQAWSLSRTSLLFFCVIPLLLGLATYLVPLQVGAPSIAFPRAAAAAFWTWLIGMGIHIATVFVDGGLGVPASALRQQGFEQVQGPNPEAVELSILSIGIVALAVLVATMCVMATVVAQRPEGMSLYEVPLFSWSMLVAGAIWMLSLPVWLANLAIAWTDFRGVDAQAFGQVDQIWDQVAWLWSQPMIFAFAIPVLGIVGEIVPVAAGRRQRLYSVMQSTIGAFGVLTFGAWAQSFFNPGPYFNPDVPQIALVVIMSLLLIVPLLAFAGGLGETLAKGKPTISGHLILAMLALITLLIAAGAAALHVAGSGLGIVREVDETWLQELIEPLEDLQGTVITTGVMQLALISALIGAVAGLYYWGPKIFGRTLMTPLGGLAGLSLVGGAIVLGAANIVNAFLDEGDRPFRATTNQGVWDENAVETFNIIGTIGALLLVAGLGLVILDITRVLFQGTEDDVDNPWDGHTLEWATASPPPVGNFVEVPVVTSERPLLDVQEGADD